MESRIFCRVAARLRLVIVFDMVRHGLLSKQLPYRLPFNLPFYVDIRTFASPSRCWRDSNPTLVFNTASRTAIKLDRVHRFHSDFSLQIHSMSLSRGTRSSFKSASSLCWLLARTRSTQHTRVAHQ